MRKSYLSIIILTVVLFVGCDKDKGRMLPLKVESEITLLKIERCLWFYTNPHLTILAKKVFFDYNQRILVIEGLTNIAGDNGGVVDFVVPEMNIKEDNLVIIIPNDSDYNVQIGETCFYLPFIEK